ncbi:MAG: ROK family protein [Candidatus Margulisbacteria bacterium]|nr:ROK family protein [Candidatus Margulisiibacteriota bacterium]
MAAERVTRYLSKPARRVLSGDIGGTNLRLAVVKQGVIERDIHVSMKEFSSAAELATRVALEISSLDLDGVKLGGIGFPCPIDGSGEPLFLPPNLTFGFNGFIKALTIASGLSIFGFNDARAAVMGEAMFGAGKSHDVVIWHGIGTGYGFAIVDGENEIFPSAAEGGHIKVVNPILDRSARECGCGARGCAEPYVSGTAMSKRYRELTGKDLDGKAVGEAFLAREKMAVKVVFEAMAHLAMAISTGHALTLNGIHVLGGGVAQIGEPLLDTLRMKLRTPGVVSWPEKNDLAKNVVLSELCDNAGLLGAAVLAEGSA